MKFEERPLTRQESSDMKSDNHYGFKLLELKSRDTTPATIVKHLDYVVHELQNDYKRGIRKPDGNESVEIALGLGAVWGNQIVREFEWEWVCLNFDEQDYCVVTSPDRSLFIATAPFVKQCFDNPQTVCTIMYVFELIAAEALTGLVAPGTYANVMSSVRPPAPMPVAPAEPVNS